MLRVSAIIIAVAAAIAIAGFLCASRNTKPPF